MVFTAMYTLAKCVIFVLLVFSLNLQVLSIIKTLYIQIFLSICYSIVKDYTVVFVDDWQVEHKYMSEFSTGFFLKDA